MALSIFSSTLFTLLLIVKPPPIRDFTPSERWFKLTCVFCVCVFPIETHGLPLPQTHRGSHRERAHIPAGPPPPPEKEAPQY